MLKNNQNFILKRIKDLTFGFKNQNYKKPLLLCRSNDQKVSFWSCATIYYIIDIDITHY